MYHSPLVVTDLVLMLIMAIAKVPMKSSTINNLKSTIQGYI
tara:strand:+ start:335 stop:457 length:123 start_codon:yes stop_codon:yes gene_type:complete